MSPFLETERLTFRTWQEDDVELARALWEDPEVARYITAEPPKPGAGAARLAAERALQAEHGLSYWPIFLRADGRHVGCCGLRPREPSILELGFHLRPEHWGQGLAHEAAVATIAHAFERADVTALFAGHHPDNAASQKLLARLGFRFRGEVFFPPTGLMHRGYLLERPR